MGGMQNLPFFGFTSWFDFILLGCYNFPLAVLTFPLAQAQAQAAKHIGLLRLGLYRYYVLAKHIQNCPSRLNFVNPDSSI